MKSLVIGATGIIGNHIVRELLNQGHEVVAGSRGVQSSQNLEGLKLKTVQLDLNDQQSLQMAFKGMDWVFQAAAYYPQNTFQKKFHLQQALQQTQNIMTALQDSSVQRLVYTSSLTTIGRVKRGELANEDVLYNLKRDPHPYFLVKHKCEEMLFRSIQNQNLPIVIVNPTGCFGPYELKPKNLCLMPQLIQKKIPAFVCSDLNIVDTADVAKGHVQAAEKGRVGERYILGGHNVTAEMLIKEICEIARVKPPRVMVPVSVGLTLGYLSEAYGYLRKQTPALSVLGLRFAQYGQHFSIDKAVHELGYEVHPMEPCFKRAIAWYQKIGYC